MLDRIRAWWNSAEATKKSEVPSRRVCVFVDASPESRHAFLWATTNLLKKEDTVHLVTVTVPPPSIDTLAVSEVPTLETLKEQRARLTREAKEAQLAASARLTDLAMDAAALGISNITAFVVKTPTSSPGKSGIGAALCEHVKSKECDVAVLGNHGRSIFRDVLAAVGLGSVSDYAVRHLPCTTVIVKPPPNVQLQASQAPPSVSAESNAPMS